MPIEIRDLLAGWEECSPQAAYDEVQREIGVRARCFPKWIEEGRLTETDARDRYQRLNKAASLVRKTYLAGAVSEILNDAWSASEGKNSQEHP